MCVWSNGSDVAPGKESLSLIRIAQCLWLFSWLC